MNSHVYPVTQCPLLTTTSTSAPKRELSHNTRNEIATCLISYLVSLAEENMNDEYFKTITHDGDVTHACSIQIHYFKSEFVNQFIAENFLNACMSNAIVSDEKFKNLLLKKKAIELIEHGVVQSIWNTLRSKKTNALKKVETEILDNKFIHRLQCVYEDVERFVDATIGEDLDYLGDAGELCVRRELINRGMLINEIIELNPKNLFIENAKCHEIFMEVKAEFYENLRESNGKISDCKINVAMRENYFESLVMHELIASNVLSKNEKQEEKKKLIYVAVEIFRKIHESCE